MSFAWVGPHVVKRVRDAIILAYRKAFSYDTKYTYVEDPVTHVVSFDCTKIVINDATPEDYYSLPSINVMTASGEEFRFIQEDFFTQEVDSNGNDVTIRGAPMRFSVTVEATALDVITRDELLDRMYERFKIITDDLSNNGVGIIKTSINADRREFKGDRWFYTSGVTLSLYVEWIEAEVIDPDSTVGRINSHIKTDKGIDQEFKLDL